MKKEEGGSREKNGKRSSEKEHLSNDVCLSIFFVRGQNANAKKNGLSLLPTVEAIQGVGMQ